MEESDTRFSLYLPTRQNILGRIWNWKNQSDPPSVTETDLYIVRNRKCPVTMIAFQFDGSNIPSRVGSLASASAWPAAFARRFSLDRCAPRAPVCPVNAELGYLPRLPGDCHNSGITVTDYISSACVRLRARETRERIADAPFATVFEARVNAPEGATRGRDTFSPDPLALHYQHTTGAIRRDRTRRIEITWNVQVCRERNCDIKCRINIATGQKSIFEGCLENNIIKNIIIIFINII